MFLIPNSSLGPHNNQPCVYLNKKVQKKEQQQQAFPRCSKFQAPDPASWTLVGLWGEPPTTQNLRGPQGPLGPQPQVLCRGKVREIFAHVEARSGHRGLGLLRRLRVLQVDHVTNGAEHGECFHQDEGRFFGAVKNGMNLGN